ncbi:hypothetical protein [Flammeovirga agarivorans]|uniref:ABC transporter ATPase n=1 Tax=Flammeovirga agarivorans TaxID=2726742 RepID=A0A7X8SI23_9BACT|nr:hypothetical protein [Flammeovirga agarivorans]NLR90517.1 hypothetical protein [Flammeovirga agarivorans]
MYKNLDTLADSSRLWIYQSNRAFTSEEITLIKNSLLQFTESWNAHGSDLQSSFDIPYNQFIVIAVDENTAAASGCSIDKCVGVIKQIESHLNISLFERTTIAYLQEEEVATFKLNEAKQLVSEGTITPTTKIFDNTVLNLGDFKSKWIVDAGNSWLKRYFVTA